MNIIDSTTFNIHDYLSFFNKIEVEREIRIGVCFFNNFYNGSPYLYILRGNERLRDKNKRALYKFLNKPESRARNHIKPNNSEIGFLQYLFFAEMGEQFALKWHTNYDKKYIICSEKKIEQIVIELRRYIQPDTDKEEIEAPLFVVDLSQLNEFEKINPAIQIKFGNEHCTISWIENETHRGIY